MESSYKQVISKYKFRILGMNHVVGVGYGVKEKGNKSTGERAVIVLVDKKLPVNNLRRYDIVPPKIEGCRTDVQEIGKLQYLNERRTRLRPAQPGASIGHYKITAGTLGAIVRDKKTGEPLILSNNHVLANITNGHDGRAMIGDPILQPGVYDDGATPDDIIGHLERFTPIVSNIASSSCPVAAELEKLASDFLHILKPDYNIKLLKRGVYNKVDCAVAKPVSPEVVDDNIMGIGKVRGITEAEVGMEVVKSGRTSGITKGIVKAINSTVQVEMSENEVVTFDEQIVTTPMSMAGDSGSLVLDRENRAVGLLFAGSQKATVCNHIGNVLEALDIEFYE